MLTTNANTTEAKLPPIEPAFGQPERTSAISMIVNAMILMLTDSPEAAA